MNKSRFQMTKEGRGLGHWRILPQRKNPLSFASFMPISHVVGLLFGFVAQILVLVVVHFGERVM